jgi:hypothetical protein
MNAALFQTLLVQSSSLLAKLAAMAAGLPLSPNGRPALLLKKNFQTGSLFGASSANPASAAQVANIPLQPTIKKLCLLLSVELGR